jgi:5S rRNA maturation endonuclease (ribonuclease M5)
VLRKGYITTAGEREKTFRQGIRHAASGRWTQKHLNGTQRLFYRLPELLQYPDAEVYVCEGEKDADRLASLELCATTVASGSWKVDTSPLQGRDVIILEDADTPGVEKARKAADALCSVAETIRIVRLPGHEYTAPKGGKDVSDWLDEDVSRGRDKLADVCLAAPLWERKTDDTTQTATPKLAVSSAEFVAGFSPPDYLIEGLLQRRFLYSLTAGTGTGKTAIALLLTIHVSQGRNLGELEIAKGAVLYFAGENPDDVRMRWMAMTQHTDALTPEDIDNVFFVPGVYKFSEIDQRIRGEMAEREIAFVVVDTSAAYFEDEDENNNVQVGAHARRLRQLIQLEGGPTVFVCCHPVKHAGDDNLLPRGGGAFLAEVDGNLICKKNDSAVEMHWQGKFRGPEFAPLTFRLETVTHERLKDTKGRTVPTVIAKLLSDEGKQEIEKAIRKDEDDVLLSISQSPELSTAGRAVALGWYQRNGQAYKMRVHRAETALKGAKLIAKARNGWEITDKGKKEVARIAKA